MQSREKLRRPSKNRLELNSTLGGLIGRTQSPSGSSNSQVPRAPPLLLRQSSDEDHQQQDGTLSSPFAQQEKAKLVPTPDDLVHALQDGWTAIRCNFVGTSSLDSEIIHAVVKTLRGRECRLKHFEFKKVHLSDDAVRVLKTGLQENLSLTYLGLERTNLTVSSAAHVADVLRARTCLTHLDLSRNNLLGDHGISKIADSLCLNRSLVCLKLETCGIGSIGGRKIVAALRENRKLEALDLASNNLADVGYEIAQVLPLSNVRNIDVRFNDIPSEALLAIEAAKTFPSNVWQMPNTSVAFESSRQWSESFPRDVWKALPIGETMKMYLEAVNQFWAEHSVGKEEPGKSWDLLGSLYAPLVVKSDISGPHFEPDRLKRIARMCLPNSRASLLELPNTRPPAHGLFIFNLTPFELTIPNGPSKLTLAAYRAASVHESPSSPAAAANQSAPLRNALPTIGRSSSKRRTSRLSTDSRPFTARTDTKHSTSSFSARCERLRISIQVQYHADAISRRRSVADHNILPEVLENVSIDQGVGEVRYQLGSGSADGAGELRCVYSVKEYGQHLAAPKNSAAMATLIWSPPAALRGVPLKELFHYWQRQKTIRRQDRQAPTDDSNMHEANERSILPSTAAAQSSLAELLDYGPAETFVSHCWGARVDSTLKALEIHAHGNLDRRVWICSIANNQRRLNDELGRDIDQSSFSQALHSRHCEAMALMLDDDCEPLRRIWCLYEVLCVIMMRDTADERHEDHVIELDLCTPEAVLNRGDCPLAIMKVAEEVRTIHAENALCTNKGDKLLIDAAIERHLGGYEEMNKRIREEVIESLEKTRDKYSSHIESLRTGLKTSDTEERVLRRKATHESKSADEMLVEERDKNHQLTLENIKLREQVKKLTQDTTNIIHLREENATLRAQLRTLQRASRTPRR